MGILTTLVAAFAPSRSTVDGRFLSRCMVMMMMVLVVLLGVLVVLLLAVLVVLMVLVVQLLVGEA